MAESDVDIRAHITELIQREKDLRQRLAQGEISQQEEHDQLRRAEVELDQLWDLLRQRDAKREYGDDPNAAQERSPGTVENYLG